MWRYLILNTLWFSMLFFVQFFGSPKSRFFVLGLIVAAGLFALGLPGLDPFAWGFYFIYSLLVYAGSFAFKRWAASRVVTLDQEHEILSGELEREEARLAGAVREVNAVRRDADEIAYLCDKMKEMSNCLDELLAFCVFGEALSKYCSFERIKLVLLNPNKKAYELFYSDFQGAFDRSQVLSNPKSVEGSCTEEDLRAISKLAESPKSVFSSERFVAYPVAAGGNLLAVFLIFGAAKKGPVIFSILSKSFAAEIQRIRLFERVEYLALTDGLTGVAVRRHLMERLSEEAERSARQNRPLSFLMIDVDDFKRFNDYYGHLVGDVILREVALTVRKNIREIDLVGRYGGEEFGVFLSETDESGAFFVAERIRRAIAEKRYRAYDEDLKITVSVGCACLASKPVAAKNAQELVERADAALYQAKRQGKNRVQLYLTDGAESL